MGEGQLHNNSISKSASPNEVCYCCVDMEWVHTVTDWKDLCFCFTFSFKKLYCSVCLFIMHIQHRCAGQIRSWKTDHMSPISQSKAEIASQSQSLIDWDSIILPVWGFDYHQRRVNSFLFPLNRNNICLFFPLLSNHSKRFNIIDGRAERSSAWKLPQHKFFENGPVRVKGG